MATGLFDVGLNLIFPPLCRSCERALDRDHRDILCKFCASSLCLLSDSRLDNGDIHPTGCVLFEAASSAVEYAPPFQQLIHQFKFNGSQRVRPLILEWFLRGVCRDLQKEDFDCIVPVPLHWWRKFQREFNQSDILGEAVATEWSTPMFPKALKRTRLTVAQSRLPKKWRESNIMRAFVAGEQPVEEKRVLLVDDVMTTGATLSACASVLRDAGAKSVSAYTFARRF